MFLLVTDFISLYFYNPYSTIIAFVPHGIQLILFIRIEILQIMGYIPSPFLIIPYFLFLLE